MRPLSWHFLGPPLLYYRVQNLRITSQSAGVEQAIVIRLHQRAPAFDRHAPIDRHGLRSSAGGAHRNGNFVPADVSVNLVENSFRSRGSERSRVADVARDEAHDVEIGVGTHGVQGPSEALDVARNVGNGPVLFVSA